MLSEYSIESTWVEKEVATALDREARTNTPVLFVVGLDETVMQTEQAWVAALRRRRTLSGFSEWTDPQAYERAFDRLLRDLKQN